MPVQTCLWVRSIHHMKEPVTETILYAYFENRATPHEKLQIKEWLREDGNEEIFYQHLAAWEVNHLQFTPNLEKASTRYKQFLEGESIAQSKIFERTKTRSLFSNISTQYAGIAASLTLLLCFGLYLSKDFFFYDTYTTTYGMTRNILLEDGSEITLNANSTLKVPKNLATTDMREVWLKGEAFFSVAKRPNHVRFAVHTDNLNVEVLGTKFDVNNRRGKTEIVLSEGSVKLTSNKKGVEPVYLKPGDFVSLAKNDTTYKRQIVKPEKYSVWQSNKLVFEDTPLRVVADKIEDYYGVKVEIERKEIADRQLTGTLPNNDLGIVLKSLSTAHNLHIDREDNKIIFR
jgi:transmembrane sensor